MEENIVASYIELKQKVKEETEQLSALENLILSNENHRKDERIKIVAGRRSISIKPETYEILESVGIETKKTVIQLKEIDDFDIKEREMILSNPENIIEKVSKESIRIVK
jgi:hypothetical protein